MKKILALFLVLLTALLSVPFAHAASDTDYVKSFIPVVEEYYSGIEDYIANALRERQTSIDISSFKVSATNIIPVFRSAVFSNPDIFYADTTYIDYIYDKSTGYIETITPTYTYKRSKIPSYVKKFNSKVNSLLSGIDKSWTDFKKALYLHDKIIVNCAYNNTGIKSYGAYNVLVNGSGVCEGYAKAYSYMLSKVGIVSKILDNSSKSHCWNLIKIGEKWYHVDLTSDDLLPDVAGFVSHKHFLCSSTRLSKNNIRLHSGFKSDVSYSDEYKCTSTKYDSSFFRTVTSEIVNVNNNLYYFNCNNHKCNFIRLKGSSKKTLKSFSEKWYTSSGSTYLNSYCRLCEHNGFIYYNTANAIYRYKIKNGKLSKIYTKPSFWKNDFYGLKYSGGYIKATLKKAETQKGTLRKIIKITSKNKAVSLPVLRYSSLNLNRKSSFNLIVYKGSGSTTFRSSNSKVVKVNSKGRITAIKTGKATVTAVKNGVKLKCKITVI